MKTTIQKNVLYAYLLLGGVLATTVHFIGVSRDQSSGIGQGLSDAIAQLLLEAYAVIFFGVIVIVSSIVGWWINHQKGQEKYVKTFKLTLLFGLIYCLSLFAFGFVSF